MRKMNIKQIINGILVSLFLGIICMLVYKTQIREKLYIPIEYTMMTEHKTTSTVILSEEMPELSEIFLCTVPDLKSINIECMPQKIDPNVKLVMTVSDATTGEICYQSRHTIQYLMTPRTKQKITMAFTEPLPESEGRLLRVHWQLLEAGETIIQLTANTKQFIVKSFNEQEGNRTNVIYTVQYSDNTCMWGLYVFLCIVVWGFILICYWMLIVRKLNVEKFFVPMSLLLGLIFQGVIIVGGVPDEPGHLDTVYRYSNQMLLVKDTGNPGTIYKRKCDVKMSDMLVNGLESNSYYQFLTDTFKKTDDTELELIEVSCLDHSSMVPAIAFIPAAIGMSIGRILRMSAMFSLQLARIFNLICFVLLSWLAIKIIPFGKNLLGMLAILPISMQQAASSSYDAVINASIFLFIALCFRMCREEKKQKWQLGLTLGLVVFIVMSKGGVYIPVLGLLVFAFPVYKWLHGKSKKRIIMWFIAGIATAISLSTLLWLKFMPLFQSFLQGETEQLTSYSLYTIPYLLEKPLRIIYIYWNTLVVKGEFLLQSFLGGVLSWLDFKMSWLFEIVFLGGLFLMTGVEEDRYDGKKRQRILMFVACGISVALIMMSMLVGYTKIRLNYIEGLQGRYFIPVAPLLFLMMENKMIHVQKKQCAIIWMTVIITEVVLILQLVAMV